MAKLEQIWTGVALFTKDYRKTFTRFLINVQQSFQVKAAGHQSPFLLTYLAAAFSFYFLSFHLPKTYIITFLASRIFIAVCSPETVRSIVNNHQEYRVWIPATSVAALITVCGYAYMEWLLQYIHSISATFITVFPRLCPLLTFSSAWSTSQNGKTSSITGRIWNEDKM